MVSSPTTTAPASLAARPCLDSGSATTPIRALVSTGCGNWNRLRMTGPFFKVSSRIATSYFASVGLRPTSKARMYLLQSERSRSQVHPRGQAYRIASHNENCSAFFKFGIVKRVFPLFFLFDAITASARLYLPGTFGRLLALRTNCWRRAGRRHSGHLTGFWRLSAVQNGDVAAIMDAMQMAMAMNQSTSL